MASNEVCDVLDVSQFLPGRSAYECVAYAAALLKYAGKPGQGPTGSALQASNLAQYWYGRLEGGTDAANKNGMSIAAMETMLAGMGLPYVLASLVSVQGVKIELARDMPCLVGGVETGMYDMELGHIPYNWAPTGNHVIVATGVAPDGNLLVHDTANVDAQGRIRPGPRIYDAGKLQIVSVTAVQIGEDMIKPLDITMPEVAALFRQLDANHWQDKATGRVLQFALLAHYKAGGVASLKVRGHIMSNEIIGTNGDAVQYCQFGADMWIKATGQVVPLDLYNPPGSSLPRILSPQPPPVGLPQEHAVLEQIKALVQAIP